MKRTRFSLVVCLALLTLALPALAGHRSRQPDRSAQLRLGGFFVDGDSDFWNENTDVFTLETSDFDGTIFGMTYSHAVNRFFDLDVNADFYGETVVSEYRDFVDDSGFSILHDSTLRMTPLTVGVRLLPFGRSNRGSRPVLFLGAGAGVNFWRYEEIGDFIDFSDPDNALVFGEFAERGEAFVKYGVCGIELPLAEGFNLGFEARFFRSDDEFRGDFGGLGKLDMDGVAASVSANWRF